MAEFPLGASAPERDECVGAAAGCEATSARAEGDLVAVKWLADLSTGRHIPEANRFAFEAPGCEGATVRTESDGLDVVALPVERAA
jgi:hypothetical protein